MAKVSKEKKKRLKVKLLEVLTKASQRAVDAAVSKTKQHSGGLAGLSKKPDDKCGAC